jgi:predicted dehydrogenase
MPAYPKARGLPLQPEKTSILDMRLAFAGFRHGHIMGFYSAAKSDRRIDVVAACEEDAATAQTLRTARQIDLTHDNFEKMLADSDCDVVAIGDYFARRGRLILGALRAAKHVIADKPICTFMDELSQIESLAKKKKLVVSALLDLRDRGPFRTMRSLIRDGAIGEVHTIVFTAQHPLLLGKRPAWYFEAGKHGGTINDIAVHAIDLVPWMTGRKIAGVVAARAWNARLPQHPHFQDAAQLMLRLDNGGGALGDVSYLTPDAIAYEAPQYWRVTCHGAEGFVETDYNSKQVTIAARNDTTTRAVPAEKDTASGRIDDLLAEIAGESREGALTTADVFAATRFALLAQELADSSSGQSA